MNITGKAIIFKNEFGYSTSISRKMEDGKYERMYVSLQLPKGTELENKTYIDITKGFITFFKDKNGLAKIKIVVMEFEKNQDKEMENFGQDLPF